MPDKTPVSPADYVDLPPAYQKCIKCPSLGTLCGGQKITALRTIECARIYHRALRRERKIQLRPIYTAAKIVSEGTIEDYFGKTTQDFKWTTVAAIDNALIAIIGDRVGQCPVETPCPDAIVELRDRCDSLVARLDEAAAENARLSQAIVTAEANAKTRLEDQRKDLDMIIRLQQARIAALESEKTDYLARNDSKRNLLAEAHAEIRRLNDKLIDTIEDYNRQIRDLIEKNH